MGNTPTSTTTQNSFQDNQTFNIDVPDMYQDFVTGDTNGKANVCIDDIRSQINISILTQSGQQLINSLNINEDTTSNTGTPNTTTPSVRGQESRCHAFYRIIGFPVISKDNTFYNPGYDPKITGVTRNVTLEYKIKIAENPIDGFNALSKAREDWVNNNLTIFSTPNSINASVFSLTSGTYGGNNASNINLRNFTAPFDKNSDPLNMTINNQLYNLSQNVLVGDTIIPLSEFQDVNGTKPNSDSVTGGLKQHYHIITPFIVDSRIDFSVYPIDSGSSAGVSKRIAVPFVQDQRYLKIGANCVAERPLLERIIRDRFAQTNAVASSGQGNQDIINYINKSQVIKNQVILGNVSQNTLANITQQSSFATYLSIIQAMVFKLVDSMRIIQKYQGYYYWLPVPSSTGPEGGCTVQPVIQSINLSDSLVTQKDYAIIVANIQSIFAQATTTTPTVSPTPDIFGTFFANTKASFNPDTTASFGNNATDTFGTLNDQRTHYLTMASNALQIIEMIMGEFSGFGLCDIIAIMASLYTMDQNVLLTFLDSDALARAQTSLGTTLKPEGNIISAMNTLASSVDLFYSIMQQTYLDYINNNSLNVNTP